MDITRALALALLLSSPAAAAVRLTISAGPLSPEAVERTALAAARLLEAPARSAEAGGLAFTGTNWKRDLAPAERERLTRSLRALWGERLSIREDGLPRAATGNAPPASALDFRGRTDAIRARLEGTPRPMGRASQDGFYDGSAAASGSAAVAAGAPRAASARRFASAAAVPKAKAAIPPPPPPAPPAAAPISWKRAGVELLKGAGGTIKDMFTWKGLAVAAASIVLVTVAPVAIYGLLVLGAAFSGWMIGKALAQGTAAYKAGDSAKFYGASREMGRGLLGLGLTMLGARHAPTNLRPHIPRTGGEWKAMAAAVDDEPIIAMSILREHAKKP